MDNINGFGERLRSLVRRPKFKSYEKAAEALGMSLSYLQQLMRGERLPSRETTLRIAQALEVSVDKLLGNDSLESKDDSAKMRIDLFGTIVSKLATLNQDELRFVLEAVTNLQRASAALKSATPEAKAISKVITSDKKQTQ